MEATFKKRPSLDTEQENAKDKQQQQAAGKEARKDKEWYERLAGAIPEDKEEQKKWYKLLTHPLTIITVLIALGYWWFNQKEKKYTLNVKENEELKTEIARLKKKCKKLKKRVRSNTSYKGDPNRYAVLD